MRFSLTTTIIFLLGLTTLAQDLPETDILWLDISYQNGQLTVGDTHHVAVRPGYDNQPYFLASNEGILFSANKGNGLTDIYLYYFSNSAIYNLTNTPATAEYSPKQLPNAATFSTITVEEDGQTQRIWQYDFPGVNRQLTFTDNKQLGYYHWLNDSNLAAFVLEDSFTLHHIQPRSGLDTLVAGPIGRCLSKHPKHNTLTYVWKPTADSTWWIKSWDMATGKQHKITPTLPGVEDYTWLPDGTLLAADKGILYHWQGQDWSPVADLSDMIPNFYRLVVGPRTQKLAIVVYKGEKP